MKPSHLTDIPPWDWPEDAGNLLLRFLEHREAPLSERLIASRLAGDLVVIDDEIARALLNLAGSVAEPVELRRVAAIALGPMLEDSDIPVFEEIDGEEDYDDRPVSRAVVGTIQKSLRHLFLDADAPKDVRRACLEASVRAADQWHEGAVLQALESEDRDWRLTGVFCAQHIGGFDKQILEALESEDPEILYEAVCAAGIWGLRDAWPRVAAIIGAATENSDRELFLAAIEAAPGIEPEEASMRLSEIVDSAAWEGDEDVRDALEEALVMCSASNELDDEDDDDDIPY